MRTPFCGKFGDESGLTLVELLVAASMAVVITGAAVALLVTSLNRQPDFTERADQVGQAQGAEETMIRDIRQGVIGTVTVTKATTPTALSKLELETYVDGRCGTTIVTTSTKCKVVYLCESEVCKRTSGTSSTNVTTIITGVKNSSGVFEATLGLSPCTSSTTELPRFIAVTLELKSRKGGVTRIENGAGMQSCS
jgi:type II secretory pathway pseudopilin PulG